MSTCCTQTCMDDKPAARAPLSEGCKPAAMRVHHVQPRHEAVAEVTRFGGTRRAPQSPERPRIKSNGAEKNSMRAHPCNKARSGSLRHADDEMNKTEAECMQDAGAHGWLSSAGMQHRRRRIIITKVTHNPATQNQHLTASHAQGRHCGSGTKLLCRTSPCTKQPLPRQIIQEQTNPAKLKTQHA